MTTQQEQDPLPDDETAAARFNEYKSLDPFPDIPVALLNSADIYDYVRTTGMIYPFDSEKLKSASYEASVGETCIRWDKKGNKQEIDLCREGSFDLAPNSIAFVTTRERFRLPDYMAVRFNLRITNVHRGLLLGTGPLVDPGFEGHILIPLHNLTTNPYTFKYEEKLIWLEFTKISTNERWANNNGSTRSRKGEYILFPENKTNKEPDYYLKGLQIRSSIPEAIREAEKSAKEAEESAKRSEKTNQIYQKFAFGGAIGIIVAVVAIVLDIRGIWVDVRSITGDIKEKQGVTSAHVEGLQDRITELKDAIESKEKQLRAMEKQVNNLQTRISALVETPEKPVALNREDLKQAETETDKRTE